MNKDFRRLSPDKWVLFQFCILSGDSQFSVLRKDLLNMFLVSFFAFSLFYVAQTGLVRHANDEDEKMKLPEWVDLECQVNKSLYIHTIFH